MRISVVFFFLLTVVLQAYTVFPVELTADGKILFQMEHTSAEKIAVAGTFNEWNKEADLLKKDSMGIWSVAVKLKPGQYEFKFVINDKDWIPSDNLKFELIRYQGRLILKGGKGFAVVYDKKSNLKISDRIFLTGFYRALFIPDYNFKTQEGAVFKNRHILALQPEIYINANAGLNLSLIFDSDKNLSLSLQQAQADFKYSAFSLSLFNNVPVFSFYDPRHLFSEYIYSSGSPVFSEPIGFYSDSNIRKFGYNYRGIVFKYKFPWFHIETLYAGPLYGNFDISAGRIKKDFASAGFSLLGLIKKGKYENYPYNETDWIRIDSSDTYYQIFPGSLSTNGSDYIQKQFGFDSYFNITKSVHLFLEYLKTEKTGGYYFRTVQSDGSDLPSDFSEYGYSYAESVFVYESPFSGSDLTAGLRFSTKNIQEEVSLGIQSYHFIPDFLSDVAPVIMSYQSVTKLHLSFMNIKNRIRFISGNKNALYYNYPILFDEDDFYSRFLKGAYQKFSVHNSMNFIVTEPLTLTCDTVYHYYFMRDICFQNKTQWGNVTFENRITGKWQFQPELSGIFSVRMKYYDFSDYITSSVFQTFSHMYYNFYTGMQYKILKNFTVFLGYGIHPDIDEEYFDGFPYYLEEKTGSTFPFFKEAENFFSQNQFISIKGELKF